MRLYVWSFILVFVFNPRSLKKNNVWKLQGDITVAKTITLCMFICNLISENICCCCQFSVAIRMLRTITESQWHTQQTQLTHWWVHWGPLILSGVAVLRVLLLFPLGPVSWPRCVLSGKAEVRGNQPDTRKWTLLCPCILSVDVQLTEVTWLSPESGGGELCTPCYESRHICGKGCTPSQKQRGG